MKEEAKKIVTKDLSEHKLQVESFEEEKNYKQRLIELGIYVIKKKIIISTEYI